MTVLGCLSWPSCVSSLKLSLLWTRLVALSCALWSSRIASEGAQLFQLEKTPHLSPCAVSGNEGFEAPLISPIPVKELRNAKGVCSSSLFVLPGKYQAEQMKWNYVGKLLVKHLQGRFTEGKCRLS